MNQFPSTVRLRGKGVYGLLILVLVASLIGAATRSVKAAGTAWYVDSSAAGSANGTSWANAWRSLSAINWSSVQPGDTVYVSGGSSSKTYSGGLSISRSGSSGLPITIDKGANSPSPAGHTGEVIISGGSYCIISTGSYFTIRNLTCQNATSSGFRVEGTSVTVENNTIRNSYSQGIHVHYCTNCVVRGNRITTHDDIAQQTDGITVYESNNTLVEKNWIKITNQNNCSGCHNDGIQASTKLGTAYKDITIRYNYVENTKASSDNAQGIYLTQMIGNVKIIGNIVNVPYGGQAVASRLYNNGAAVSVSVIGNTIKNGGYYNLRVEDDNPVIKNNIIWQTGGNTGYITGGAIIRLDGRSSSATASNIDYNLLYAPYTNNAFSRDGSGTSWSTWQGTGVDAHSAYQNPALDSCYRPTSSTSPSVNKGTALAAEFDAGIAVSACGQNGPTGYLPVTMTSRSSSGGWDIGAYEFGGVVSVPTTAPTSAVPTATRAAPTATRAAPTATRVAPTATRPAPTATRVSPTLVPANSNKIYLPWIDTTVDESQPEANFGGLPVMAADSRPEVVSFLRFDVSGLEGRAITKATLRVFIDRKGSRPVTVNGVTSDGSWTEAGVTFYTAPAVGQPVASAQVSDSSIWVSLDVTPLVRGEGAVEFALTTSGRSAVQFATKESGDKAPQLVLELL